MAMGNFARYLVALCWIFFHFATAQKTAIDFMKEEVWNNDKIKLPPSTASKKATELSVGVYINSLSFDEEKMALNIYFRNRWRDTRLEFDSNQYGGEESLRLPEDAYKSMWIPDLFFKNAQTTEMKKLRKELNLMTVNSTGHVWFVSQLSITLKCPFKKLQKYPFDTQTCPLIVESFGYTMDTLYFQWLSNPVSIDRHIIVPHFTLVDTILYDCSQNYTTGAFPCLEVNLVLRRDSGFYVLQVFIPSIVLIIMSWFSFWMDVKSYNQRIGVLFLILITLLIHYLYSTMHLPKVSYIKAIDVWMLICLISLFTAVIESTIVKVIGSHSGSEEDKGSSMNRMCYFPKVARILDVVSRVVIPGLFVLICIFYFSLYSA